jgi:hypothetical protein
MQSASKNADSRHEREGYECYSCRKAFEMRCASAPQGHFFPRLDTTKQIEQTN